MAKKTVPVNKALARKASMNMIQAKKMQGAMSKNLMSSAHLEAPNVLVGYWDPIPDRPWTWLGNAVWFLKKANRQAMINESIRSAAVQDQLTKAVKQDAKAIAIHVRDMYTNIKTAIAEGRLVREEVTQGTYAALKRERERRGPHRTEWRLAAPLTLKDIRLVQYRLVPGPKGISGGQTFWFQVCAQLRTSEVYVVHGPNGKVLAGSHEPFKQEAVWVFCKAHQVVAEGEQPVVDSELHGGWRLCARVRDKCLERGEGFEVADQIPSDAQRQRLDAAWEGQKLAMKTDQGWAGRFAKLML